MNQPSRSITLGRVIRGHNGYIFRLKWSPCGRYLASPSADCTIGVWDTLTGRLATSLIAHDGEVNSVAWHPTLNKLASAADDHRVIVWDVAEAIPIQSYSEHRDEVNDVAWSHDGQYLASVSDDKQVLLRDLKTGTLNTLLGHTHAIWTVSWSPDNTWLATGSDDETVRLWSPQSSEQRVLRGHTSTVRCVRWIPGSTQVASSSRDTTVRIWDMDFPGNHHTLSAHDSVVTSITVSHDGRLLASKSHDNLVRIWRTDTWHCVGEFPEESSGRWSCGADFHPSNYSLATLGEEDSVIRLWNVKEDLLRLGGRNPNATANSVVFVSYSHRDGKWLDRLLTMLRPIVSDNSISLWVDTDIEPGMKWLQEIERALDHATLAIMLVTPDFLASKFITEVELPRLLERAHRGDLAVIWLPIQSALYEEAGLDEFQAGVDPARPLNSLPAAKQNSALAQVCRTIKQLVQKRTH